MELVESLSSPHMFFSYADMSAFDKAEHDEYIFACAFVCFNEKCAPKDFFFDKSETCWIYWRKMGLSPDEAVESRFGVTFQKDKYREFFK